MTKLSDTQAILLSSASQRDDRSLYPLPDTIKAGASITKAIEKLIDSGLADERETNVVASVCRTDGDVRYGMFATHAGLAKIGLSDAPVAAPPAAEVKPARSSKSATMIALLKRPDGATMSALIAATGWLPHTTRAALSGLRKKGHTIERTKRDDQTCYRIVAAA